MKRALKITTHINGDYNPKMINLFFLATASRVRKGLKL
jgi:hypothetical protein